MIAPTEIQVDLEAYCNDNCEFCSYRKEDGYNNTMLGLISAEPGKKYHESKPIGKPSPESRIPTEFAKKFPEQMVEAGIMAIEITGGGEPTLWPALDELIENLGKANREIGLVTNGSNLSDKRIDLICKYCLWVRISMDSSNHIIHKRIHRTTNYDFERRLEHIRKLVRYSNDNLTVGISFIITPENYDDVEAAARLFASVGVNHIRFSWMYDRQGTAGLTTEQVEKLNILFPKLQEELNTDSFKIFYEANRISLYNKPNEFETCHYQKFVWAIGADCNVYPCCIMKYHPEYANGNIKEKTLKQIIDDHHTKEKQDSLVPAKCFPCWLRNRNASIASAVEKPKHYNFI